MSDKYRLTVFVSLLVITPLGFASKLYHGPLSWWFNDYGGGILYEMFWILLVAFVWPAAKPIRIATAVFLLTALLEFLQLWRPLFLQMIRSNLLGRTLIGTTFVWWDFPHYVLGCVMGWLWIKFLKTRD